MPESTILGTTDVGNDISPEGMPAPDAGTDLTGSSAVSEAQPDSEGASTEGGTTAEKEPTVPESRYKEAERKITEQGQALAELRGRQAVLDEMQQRAAESENQKDPWAWLDDDKLTESFEEDPTNTFKSTIEKVMRQVGGLMQDQASYYDAQIQQLKPEAQEAKRAMTELAGQEWFNAIPDDQKQGAAMAYIKLKSQMNGGGEQPPTAPSGMGGGKSAGRAPKKAVPMQDDPRYQGILHRMGGISGGLEKPTLMGK